MAIDNELEKEVKSIFTQTWETNDTETVPAPEDIRLKSNHKKKLGWAAVLYADLDGSTNLVNSQSADFSAEIYKTYLWCAGQLIRHCDGAITAYDGDRIMGIFVGTYKHTNAVTCAFNINYAVTQVINPAIQRHYPSKTYQIAHVVGVDASPLQAARTGVPVYNDIVWVGRAANYAAKLSALPSTYAIRITDTVYDKMNDTVKRRLDGSTDFWETATWNETGGTIYRTNYWRKPS